MIHLKQMNAYENTLQPIILTELPLMDYMLPHKAAERLQVSRTTIWRWIREGRFEGVRRKGFGETSPQMIPVSSVEKLALDLKLPPEDSDETCNGSV